MRKLILGAALALLLTSCGQIDEPITTQSPGAAPAETSAIEGQEITTTEEPVQEPDETQATEITEEPVETTVTEEPAETTSAEEPEPEDLGEYMDSILSGPYGFELYMDGHIDAWDQREQCARLILTAAAQPGTEYTALDEAVSLEQLNAYETRGFMTHLKFEEEQPFRVGNETVPGVTLLVIGEDGGYMFCIERFDGNGDYVSSPFYDFDQEYVPLILEAAQAE